MPADDAGRITGNVFAKAGVRIIMTHGKWAMRHGMIVGLDKDEVGNEWLEVLLDDYETPVRCRSFMLQLEQRVDDED